MFVYDEKDTEEESQSIWNFMAPQSFSGSSEMADPNHSDWTASIFFPLSFHFVVFFLQSRCSFMKKKVFEWNSLISGLADIVLIRVFIAPLIVMDL